MDATMKQWTEHEKDVEGEFDCFIPPIIVKIM